MQPVVQRSEQRTLGLYRLGISHCHVRRPAADANIQRHRLLQDSTLEEGQGDASDFYRRHLRQGHQLPVRLRRVIRPAETLTLKSASATPDGAKVIENYQTFLKTALEMVKRRKALDHRCSVLSLSS
jgi:hypothetical protein